MTRRTGSKTGSMVNLAPDELDRAVELFELLETYARRADPSLSLARTVRELRVLFLGGDEL